MTTPYPSSGTPYIVPDGGALQSWPIGVDWSTLPPGTNVTAGQRQAALASVCASATAQVAGYMNFPLHAVLNTEQEQGPDFRITIRPTGEARMILARWPITQIVSVQVAPSGVYPLQWTTVPSGFWRPEYPVIGRPNSSTPSGSGEGGQAILIAPSYVTWGYGRWGTVVQVQYYSGWPHTHLTATATPATPPAPQTIQVADCTSWAPITAGQVGAEGVIYDSTGGQEDITVTAASATTGPGTLTLASPLGYTHQANVMLSSLPADIIWAAALFAGAEALTRGAQATVVQATPGARAGGTGATGLIDQARSILSTFRKTI